VDWSGCGGEVQASGICRRALARAACIDYGHWLGIVKRDDDQLMFTLECKVIFFL